jgi:hypothetical protein
MPCALTEPGNYPDYLKRILKTIAVGNDTDLKTCACSLRSPLTTEGCPAIGGDGKIGAFPFCTQESADSKYAIWPLEKAMETYWRVRAWDFSAAVTVKPFEDDEFLVTTSIKNIRSAANKESDLVCFNEFVDPEEAYKSADIFFGPLSFGNQFLQKVDNLYYSGLGGYFSNDLFNPLVELEFSFGADVNIYGNDFPFSVLGANLKISVNAYMEDQPDFYNPAIGCTASLTPSSYWP